MLSTDYCLPEQKSARGAVGSAGEIRSGLSACGLHVQLDATVSLAAVGVGVRRNRLRFTVGHGVETVVIDSEGFQVVGHAVGAPLGQPLVIGGSTFGVRVTLDRDGRVVVTAEYISHLAKRITGARPKRRRVEVKEHFVFH